MLSGSKSLRTGLFGLVEEDEVEDAAWNSMTVGEIINDEIPATLERLNHFCFSSTSPSQHDA